MAYRDLLLTALTYPDATPDRAIRSGVALARRLGGKLTFLTVRIDLPQLHNRLANALMDLDQLSDIEQARSAATADLEAVCARIAAEIFKAPIEVATVTARLYEETDVVVRAARTRDLILAPIGPAVLADRSLAETILFDAGRPLLVYPEAAQITAGDGFARVSVAWDGGRAAARAVADALPILAAAGEVRIFTALGDKPQADSGSAADLVRHLREHGIQAKVDERLDSDRRIGARLKAYVDEVKPDLLVMGAYGHARLREFILGGATEAILEDPPCPVLMSH